MTDRLEAAIKLLESMGSRNKLPSDGKGLYLCDGVLRPHLGDDDHLRSNELLSMLRELRRLTAVEPPEGVLESMAIRYDHGLAVPGYYDQPMFTNGCSEVTHQDRLESTIRIMRQLREEAVGNGFYNLPEA